MWNHSPSLVSPELEIQHLPKYYFGYKEQFWLHLLKYNGEDDILP